MKFIISKLNLVKFQNIYKFVKKNNIFIEKPNLLYTVGPSSDTEERSELRIEIEQQLTTIMYQKYVPDDKRLELKSLADQIEKVLENFHLLTVYSLENMQQVDMEEAILYSILKAKQQNEDELSNFYQQFKIELPRCLF